VRWDGGGTESLHTVKVDEAPGSDAGQVRINFFPSSLGLDAPVLVSLSRSGIVKDEAYLRVMAKWLPLSIPSSRYLSE